MKRLHIVVALLLVTLLLSACGGTPETDTPAEEETALETAVPVEDVKEPEPNPDEAGGAANPNVPDTNIGTGGEPVEMGEDGTYTEAPEEDTTTTQPPVEQTTPVQQNPAPANNGGSGSSGSGSGSSSGTYSDGSISHNGTVVVNGKTHTGVRVFASVSDLDGVEPYNISEIVSVNGVPYVWNFTEWIDYSGFSTEVEVVDIGGLSGELVGY